MNEDGYVLALVGGLIVVAAVFEMVRRRYLRGRFAIIWLAVALATIVLALAPELLDWAATVTGVKVPLNLLFFVGFLGLLIIIMHLSAESGRLEERTRILAEDVAILRSRLPPKGETNSEVATATQDDVARSD
jgi:hypothetical protein